MKMRKIEHYLNTFILFFGLTCASISFADTWRMYWENSDAISYYEPFSVSYSNSEVEVQVLNDFKEIHYTENGEKYSSTTVIKKINCETGNYKSVYLMVWQLPKAEGKAIYINHKEYSKNSVVIANSNMASLFEIVCNEKNYEKIVEIHNDIIIK